MSQPGSPSNSIKREEEDSEGQIATQLAGSERQSTPEEEIQVLPAAAPSVRTRSNTARSIYQSQADDTPPEFQSLIPVQQLILQPAQPQPRRVGRMATRAAPVLQRAGGLPTVDELEAYGTAVEEYIAHCSFFLTMLQEDGRIITDNLPGRPDRGRSSS